MEASTNKKALELDGASREFESHLPFSAVSNELKNLLAPARVVTEIYVNDKPVSIQEEETLSTVPFKDLGKVVIKSREVNELYRESLNLAPQICEALKLDVQDVIRFFQTGDIQTAQERVSEMTALLEWLLQLISGFQAIAQFNLQEMKFSKGLVMESVDRMQALLTDLHVNLSEQKWEPFQTQLQGPFIQEVEVWKILFEEVSTKKWGPEN